jgi:1-acyl-sn-glycerol-3-phosphate acyltransferase
MREAALTAGSAPVRSSLANRWWRVAGTGFSFALFGLGGLLLGVVVFPLLLAVIRHHRRRSALARGIIRLDRRGLLILASHPSLIDVVFLMALVRDADCIVKSALARNPFTRGPVRAAGYVFNDSGPGLIDDCVASVRSGNNLIVFPEGTRTPAGVALGRLQRGAANLAVRGALPITPVRITCEPRMLGKGIKWWRVPPTPGNFVIEVGEDMPIDDHLAAEGAQALAARRLNDELARRLGAETPHAAA